MSHTILRTAKLSTIGNIAASAQHNFRERETPNANPQRTDENRTTGAQSANAVVAGVKSRLQGVVGKVRKNAVLAVEYLITASPEWFQGQSQEAREAYFDEAEKWLNKRHGAENVIACTRQYDETSPHICAYVVPIDPKGKLNASYFLDGRERLSEMQTNFAENVGRRFNLERGIEGSKAKHQTIKQYYTRVNEPTPELKTKVPAVAKPTIKEKVAEALGIDTEHARALEQQAKARERRNAEMQAIRKAEHAKAKQYDVVKSAQEARDAKLAELRATSTQARDLPLDRVLERLGCIPDKKDEHNWTTPVGRLTVTGSKFYAHDAGKGGGGAIDLVMLLEDADYRGAVRRLSQDFGTGPVLEQALVRLKEEVEDAAKSPPPPYRAPAPVLENWPRVRRYLTETRSLSGDLVDKLHDAGKVYADRYSNAVFHLGKGVGVELRGTADKPFHGVRGEKAAFVLVSSPAKKVAFVESAIDAMSLVDFGFQGTVVSTSGNAATRAKEMAASFRTHGFDVIAAFDADKAGDAMSAALGLAQRMRPNFGKDWNDVLQARKDGLLTPASDLAPLPEKTPQQATTTGPALGPLGPDLDLPM